MLFGEQTRVCYTSQDWESSAAMDCSSFCTAFATSSRIMAFSERIRSFSFCIWEITLYDEVAPPPTPPSA